MDHGAVVNCAAFSPDGKTIVTGDADETARLWDAIGGYPIGEAMVHGAMVNCVTFSPNGETVVTGGADAKARLWDAATGSPIGEPLIHQIAVDASGYSMDGKTIFMSSGDGTARLIDASTRRPVGPLFMRASGASPVSVSSDCKTVLAWSGDRTVRLWDAATGQPIGPPLEQDGANPMQFDSLAFSPDGRSIVAASENGRRTGEPSTARLWHLPALVDDELHRIGAWVETATGLSVDDEGNVNALQTAAWQERHSRLRELGGPPQADSAWLLDPITHGPDPTARARAWVERKCWLEAEAAFAKVIRARPLPTKVAADFVQALALRDRDPKLLPEIITTDPIFDRILAIIPAQSSGLAAELLATRAEHLARRSQWPRAAADFREAARLRPLDSWTAFRQIMVLQAAGNRDEARSVASGLFERLRKTTDPYERTLSARATANTLAWCLVLAPGSVADRAFPVHWAASDLGDTGAAKEAGGDLLTTSYPFDRNPQRTKQIAEKLELPIPMSFPVETTLDDVLKHIKQATTTPTYLGIPIYVDPVGLMEAEKSMTSTVKINPGRLPLKTSLRLILEQIGLTYSVRDGFLEITSLESDDQPTEVLSDAVPGPTLVSQSHPGESRGTGGHIGRAVGVLGSETTSIPAAGAALCRAGKFEESVRRLEERTKLLNGAEEPTDWPFLAMAHHRLGDSDEARRWLDRLHNRQPSTDPNRFWTELEIYLLRSEAEAVVLYDPIFPADPFAH